MEQQKILWIILSVAVLLLAVLGTVLFVFGPSSSDSASGNLSSERVIDTGSFDPVEWARSSGDYPGIPETDESKDDGDGEFVVIYGDGLGKDEVPSDGQSTVIDVADIAVKKSTSSETAVAPAPVVRKPAPAPAPKTPAPKTPAPKAPAPLKTVQEYWIQAGSFSSMTRAEEARKLLVSKGFPAAIQTKTVDGKDFYRVRTGSYPAKEEAEKFLHWIKEIDGFSQSYVSQVQVQR